MGTQQSHRLGRVVEVDLNGAICANSGRPTVDRPHPRGVHEARRFVWTEADRPLVEDRVETQFVGSPGQVADQLEQLRDATGADELIITTITHDHVDRVRSYALLADEWSKR